MRLQRIDILSKRLHCTYFASALNYVVLLIAIVIDACLFACFFEALMEP